MPRTGKIERRDACVSLKRAVGALEQSARPPPSYRAEGAPPYRTEDERRDRADLDAFSKQMADLTLLARRERVAPGAPTLVDEARQMAAAQGMRPLAPFHVCTHCGKVGYGVTDYF